MSGADLRDATLSGADLRDADLRDATLISADLSTANLSGAITVGARWSLDTEWPAELYEGIRNRSDEIEPGIFRIRGSEGRDREGTPA
ncbi:pentapeptide repeat-containing protein [Streptomyces sp. NPDC054804]